VPFCRLVDERIEIVRAVVALELNGFAALAEQLYTDEIAALSTRRLPPSYLPPPSHAPSTPPAGTPPPSAEDDFSDSY
jgi:hypothetical protein